MRPETSQERGQRMLEEWRRGLHRDPAETPAEANERAEAGEGPSMSWDCLSAQILAARAERDGLARLMRRGR